VAEDKFKALEEEEKEVAAKLSKLIVEKEKAADAAREKKLREAKLKDKKDAFDEAEWMESRLNKIQENIA